METEKYYVGLDMGTNSVGWAVTDREYRIVRVKGKDFWGIREFEEAKTAVDRRSKRVSRRRRQRAQVRSGLVRSYFEPAVLAEDPLFYIRMDNSKFFEEDKDQVIGKNAIFDDEDYKDADYYSEYPTIYHLRKALLEDTVPHDSRYARKVYLAIHNMFKHRGHFLESGLSEKESMNSMTILYSEFVEQVDLVLDLSFPSGVAEEIKEILSDSGLSRSAKSDKIAEVCHFDKGNKKELLLIRAICGLKLDAKKVFDGLDDIEEKIEIEFSSASYEEKVEELASVLGDENFELIEIMKDIYDTGMLAKILHDYQYLSESRVALYEKHHADLKLLKEVYKEHFSEDIYDKMFRGGKEGAEDGKYSAYVNSYNTEKLNETGKPMRRTADSRTKEALYTSIKKDLKDLKDDRAEYILKQIDTDNFLPKQLTPGNGVIPNQVHRREMKAILKQAEKYLPTLREKDDSGLTTSERILKLFSFQIPYFIGPTTEKSKECGGNGWVVRKEEGQILPWNIEDKIDYQKTSEEFIKRLIRNCTYLSNEKVLPKASLIYERFCVLNEINNMKIDGEPISVELKQEIYTELFCKGKKVTRKQIENFLANRGCLSESAQLTGIDTAINNSLSSYGKFRGVFGEMLDTDEYQKIAENIIYLATVYGDSKKMLRECLQKEYQDILDEGQIKRILGFKFKDWGKMSREFLELQGCDTTTGEVKSLISAMWDTNENLMELLHSEQFTFGKELQAKQIKQLESLKDFQANDLDEFYFSAPVKRMVWQTILLIKEIIKVMGNPPEKVFIEMTRSEEEKKGDQGRKASRGKQLLELYKTVKNEERDWKKEIESADESGKLRSKKLYLYYLQMGRCMYTGEPIELDELFSTKYDIDHIYPRHYVKDDNLSNNLVLVKKESNAYKSDNYPLVEMKPEVYQLWKLLHAKKLISDEKYRRLTGKNPFTDEQKADFIARQLVETSQGTKGVADLLKQLLPEKTTVVYAKARNVSDFRRDNGFFKSRIVNDFHHAKDAYLNIVVGNVYFTKFTQNPLNFIKRELAMDQKKNHYNLGRMFDWNVERGGLVAWVARNEEKGIEGSIATVQKMMAKNTPMMTRLSFEGHGGITKETVHPSRKAKKGIYFPMKTSDERLANVERYGGYSDIATAYFFVVEHTMKKERVRTIESVPVYLSKAVENNPDKLEEYCVNVLELKEPSVRVRKIRIQSLMRYNGYEMYISGKMNGGKYYTLWNATNLCLCQEMVNYVKSLEKYGDEKIVSDNICREKNIELYNELREKHDTGVYSRRPVPISKILNDGLEKFEKLEIENQCNILLGILKLSYIGTPNADLEDIGGKKNSGKMYISKMITEKNAPVIVNQSVTGLFENTINLMTV
ncbi:MAG: type II CRISPR RNA-guided endonuclease Cas9 [Lachnospiraceae bacterium]|nr:type II CRISPR RNA-guided endonuclease Cas9 [Lachnospiraceae bacterium]